MAIFNEDFARCTECGGGWFIMKEAVLIAKDSDSENPIEIQKGITYACEQCGHQQYSKRLLEERMG